MGAVAPGGVVTYKISVSSVGTDPWTGAATVTDVLPANVQNSSASGSGWTCTQAPPGTWTCVTTDLTTAGLITISGQRSADPCHGFTNTATVFGPSSDVSTANNTSSATVECANGAPDLTITKLASSTEVALNDQLTYQLSVTNAGSVTYNGVVTVTDSLPAGLTYVSHSAPAGWTCNFAAPTLTCTRSGSLGNVSLIPITLEVQRTDPDCTSLTNTATVTGDPPDINLTNNSASVTVACTAALGLDLAIVKTASQAAAAPGAAFSYTLHVTNAGPSSDVGLLSVDDVLPAEVTFVSTAQPAGWNCAHDSASHTVSCDGPATVAVGGPGVDIVITVTRTTSACTSFTNTASATTNMADTDLTNNSSSAAVACTSTDPDLVITKTASVTEVVDEQEFTYTIVAGNFGGAAMTGSTTVQDKLPAEVAFVMVDAAAPWSCTSGGTPITLTCTWPLALAAGESATPITVHVKRTADSCSTIVNTAKFILAFDPPGGNESTVTVQCAPGFAGGSGERRTALYESVRTALGLNQTPPARRSWFARAIG